MDSTTDGATIGFSTEVFNQSDAKRGITSVDSAAPGLSEATNWRPGRPRYSMRNSLQRFLRLGVQNAGALLRHFAQRKRRLGCGSQSRFAAVGRIAGRLSHGVIEFLPAAIDGRIGVGLVGAILVAGSALDAHVDVVIMPAADACFAGTNTGEPPAIFAVCVFLLAEIFLDGRCGENTRDVVGLGGSAHHVGVCLCPDIGIELSAVDFENRRKRHGLSLDIGQLAIGHRHEPDVDIESACVTGVTIRHRSAARHAHITDEKPVVTLLGSASADLAERFDSPRMTPISVARGAHNLMMRTVQRKLIGTGDASVGVAADRLGRQCRRLTLSGKQLAGVGAAGKHRNSSCNNRNECDGNGNRSKTSDEILHVLPR